MYAAGLGVKQDTAMVRTPSSIYAGRLPIAPDFMEICSPYYITTLRRLVTMPVHVCHWAIAICMALAFRSRVNPRFDTI